MSEYKIEKQKIEPVKVITIDEVQHKIEDMSKPVQQIVNIFNRWNDNEADAQYELNLLADKVTMIRAAKDTISRQILEKIREENESSSEEKGEEAVESSDVKAD